MKTILIVEDNNEMQELLKKVLQAHYQLVSAYSGTEGLLLFNANSIDLVLLDRMLPGKSGDEVLGELRQQTKIPVIILTALDTRPDIAKLLLAGANDYITKPFDIEELQARISVQLRDHVTKSTVASVQYKAITLLPATFSITNGAQTQLLKKKEFDILKTLFTHPKQIFTKKQLYRAVWQAEYYDDDNTMNVHLSNLRKVLQTMDPNNNYIQTVWGIGVKLA
ncbi:DNA-binding response regulator [Loigolactobacillus backii]|uniref:DNA-binding response regulator n=1 Tax=Loigolactobacillus backii TaxID=375175 RepID=A0A192H295_9LACO|nr:response regulator transcription factor [Loigolactobacillus backii]ANK60200.1 DNA-binding response regulator [Loigolactobacillus backii]ANK62357.1 DNA-binding response regulator [Loigolactobacillus backii]ANK65082.1 DNA-binding response regulator [Loigolactobacillus backii]ANK67641.1 DNA-binding response regulator [Loigolactobacillus backii]ANK70631.1 DNA-binding response regulator [Loigolactobacillus backii]